MRILLDENLPRQLKQHFTADIEALTVQERGWSGKKNAELLRLAAEEFDVLLTMDRGVEFQQRVESLSIAILIIRASSNRFEDLQPLIPEVREVLKGIHPGQVTRVGSRPAT
jgi:predicted nuclease of predicted toxin-antitoxin system